MRMGNGGWLMDCVIIFNEDMRTKN